MSYGRLGFAAMTDRALGSPKDINFGNKQNGQILLRVVDIILDENHPKYQPLKGLSQIGAIEGNEVNPDGTIIPTIINAIPSPGSSMKYPTVNEHVELIQSTIPNSNGIQWLYQEPLGLYGTSTPNGNQFPSVTQDITPPSQNLDYTQIGTGAINIVDNQPQEIVVNSLDNPSQATFVEKSNMSVKFDIAFLCSKIFNVFVVL
jgi:hypothetical protein